MIRLQLYKKEGEFICYKDNKHIEYFIDLQTQSKTNFFLYDKSTVGSGGIWTLDVYIGNTKKCQLNYKTLEKEQVISLIQNKLK